MEQIIEYIKRAFASIKQLIVKFINGCINFVKHILSWFKNLPLIQARDVPFIANANSEEFKQLLKKAPVKNVGIFQGVYNQETEEITHHEYLDADSVDEETYNVLGKESLVVLS